MADTKLYDGEITISFDGRKHAYTWQEKGMFVPGVTSILKRLSKDMLMPWAAKMASQYVFDKMVTSNSGGMARQDFDRILNIMKRNDGTAMGFLGDELGFYRVITTIGDLEKVCLDAKGAHMRVAREAAGIGKQVHGYAEQYLLSTMPGSRRRVPNYPDTNDQRIIAGCDAFSKWVDAHRVEVIQPEKVIFSKQHYYCGTCDFYGYIDGELVIGDFKTSKGIYVDHLLQTAAYQVAVEEELKVRIPARWLIRLDKRSGEFHAERFERSNLHSEAFLALRALHELLTKVEDQFHNAA